MSRLLLIILAIVLPPLAVLLRDGFGFHFFLNIVLVFISFGIGAIIHALWLVSRPETAVA